MNEREQAKTTAIHVAKAFQLVSQANHYMVGFTYRVTEEELKMAKQILIATEDNAINSRAIDLIEMELRGKNFLR